MDTDQDRLSQGLFFIVGTGRCGTTLLQTMLSGHSQISAPPETRFFGAADCRSAGYHDPLRDDEVEPYIKSRVEDWWWQELGIAGERFQSAVRSGMRSSRSIYLWMLRELLTATAKPRIGEKTPYYGMWAEYLRNQFSKAKFIHIHRDPRDVIVSLRSQQWWKTKSALSCALLCREVLDQQKKLAEAWGDEIILTVRYETLVEEPGRELKRVCRFLGEPYESQMLAKNNRSEVHILEIEQEWKELALRPLTRSRIGRYRDELTDRETRLVEWILGPVLQTHGYVRDSVADDESEWEVEFQEELKQWQEERAADGPEQHVDVEPILQKRRSTDRPD